MGVPMTSGKKKLLIVNNNLAIGGVQRSLVNLLDQIKDKYDITLFVFYRGGEYSNFIPPQVKIKEASPLLRLLGMSQSQTKKLGYIYYLIRAFLALYSKIVSNHLPIRLLISSQKKISGFDIAISYLHSAPEKLFYGGCNEFVLDRVIADQKITFLHCDFLNYGGNTPLNCKVYEQFDNIAAVSEGCRQSFIKAIPKLAAKTHCVRNFYNYSEYIYNANNNPIDYPKDSLNIITVARLNSEKGILRGIDVIKRLVAQKYRVRWHIIGDGSQRNEIENKIMINELSNYIKLYGNQENPYRFIKNSDLLWLPSYHEAAPMVVDEAKCLGVPIITTYTTSAKEMVKEGLEGLVCGNNEDEMYRALRKVLDEPSLIEKCQEYLNAQKYTNEKAVNQFSKLIEEVELSKWNKSS